MLVLPCENQYRHDGRNGNGSKQIRMKAKIFLQAFVLVVVMLYAGQVKGQLHKQYSYPLNVTPRGNGPVLENFTFKLDLATNRGDGTATEVYIIVTGHNAIKKSKYKGKVYNVSCPLDKIAYQIRLNNGTTKSGEVKFPAVLGNTIHINLGREYDITKLGDLPMEQKREKFINQFGISSFQITNVMTNDFGIEKIQEYIAKQSPQKAETQSTKPTIKNIQIPGAGQNPSSSRITENASTKPASAASTASSATANHTTYDTNHTTASTKTTMSSNSVTDGPYKDPELNRRAAEQRAKMEETRRKVEAMKAQLARTQQQAANLDRASDQTFEAWQNAGDDVNAYIQGAKPLVNEFAKQGNVGGAITAGAMGLGLGILKSAQANKARNEAAAAERAERDRIRREEEAKRAKFEAEQARLRKEAFELLISQRHSILEVFSENEPIPLSTTKVASDKIYYFIYAIDPTSIDQEQTSVYVSNVFEIAQYHDGTWPYQSAIEKETQALTPYTEVLQGYYLDAKDAMAMRQEFINGFRSNKGVSVIDIVYKEAPLIPGDAADGTGGNLPEQTNQTKPVSGGLGIPLGDGKAAPAKPSKERVDREKKDTNGLGIPLNL